MKYLKGFVFYGAINHSELRACGVSEKLLGLEITWLSEWHGRNVWHRAQSREANEQGKENFLHKWNTINVNENLSDLWFDLSRGKLQD